MPNRSQQKLHIEVAQKTSHVMSLNQTSGRWNGASAGGEAPESGIFTVLMEDNDEMADNIDNPYMSRKWEGRLFLTQKPVGFCFQESSTQCSQPQIQGIFHTFQYTKPHHVSFCCFLADHFWKITRLESGIWTWEPWPHTSWKFPSTWETYGMGPTLERGPTIGGWVKKSILFGKKDS